MSRFTEFVASARADIAAIWELRTSIAEHYGKFWQSVCAHTLAQVATIVATVTTAWVAGQVLVGAVGPTGHGVPVWVALVLGVAVLCVAVGTWWEVYVAHDLAYVVLATLRVRLFDRFSKTLPGRSRSRHSGDLAATAMSDVESLEWVFAHVISQVGVALAAILTGVGALAILAPATLVVLVPAAAVLLTIPWWWHRSGTEQGAGLREGHAEYSAKLLDTVAGMSDLRSAGAVDRQVAAVDAAAGRVQGVAVRNARRGAREAASGDAVTSLAVVASLAVVVWGVSAGWTPLANAPLVIAWMGVVLAPAVTVAGTLKELGGLRSAIGRVFGTLRAPDVAPEPPADRCVGELPAPCAGVPVVALDDVTFGYDPDAPVVERFSVDVRVGETVALVGPSGCGKSTVCALIQRFYHPDAGAVSLLGVPYDRISDETLRATVAVVGQDVAMFSGTIAENLRLARPEATDEELWRALEVACLTDEVAALPDGVDTSVTEGASSLSGGQRARLAIARAVLVQPKLLVLDESTAALDATTELAVHQALEAGAEDRATLIVAHRPSSIDRADRVVRVGG